MTMRPEPYLHLDSEAVYRGLDGLAAAAAERGVDMPTLAFAWLLADPRVTAVVVGPRRPEHLEPALAALEQPATAAERDELGRLFCNPEFSDRPTPGTLRRISMQRLALAALLAAGVVAAAASAASGPGIVTLDGIGGVVPGMTAEQVATAWGIPISVTSTLCTIVSIHPGRHAATRSFTTGSSVRSSSTTACTR